jgi:branched-chain amino acid transport system ATP-binding protein
LTIIAAEEVTVRFGGLVALDKVSLAVDSPGVTGLIGPNGAGKSTLLAVLSGLVRPAHGRVMIGDKNATKAPAHRRAAMGLSRTFQRLELWGSMTVAENVITAGEFARRWKALDPDAVADRVLGKLGLERIRDVPVATLSSGLARLVEVARALASEPTVLLLDEPSAGLNTREALELGDVLSEVAASGTAVVLVEHHVDLVMKTCDEIWVLDFGRVIAHGTPPEIRSAKAVQQAYLGVRGEGNA